MEVSNEVAGDLLEEARSVGFDQGEWRDSWMCV